MALHVRVDEQLQQDLAVAAGEGEEAVNMDPEIPVLYLVPEEMSPVAMKALKVRL